MTRKIAPVNFADLGSLYLAGESLEAIAARLHIGQTNLRRKFSAMRIPIRNRHEAFKLRMQKEGPDGRQRLTKAAHDAVRGSTRLPESSQKSAQTRAVIKQHSQWIRGRFEGQMYDLLKKVGQSPIPQQPVAGYNLDLGLFPIAVEVHVAANNPLTDKRHRKRIENINKLGWTCIYIWITVAHPLTISAAHEIVRFKDVTQSNHSSTCKNWVIRGTGELISIFCVNRD